MNSQRSHYDTLQVGKEASEADIKRAYHRLAQVHHPDKGGSGEIFKRTANAYSVLSDKSKRRDYDRRCDNQSFCLHKTTVIVNGKQTVHERRYQNGKLSEKVYQVR